MAYLYFVCLALSFVFGYIYMRKDDSLKMKMINSGIFVAAGLILLLTNERYELPYCRLLFAGLCASFIGDGTLHIDAFDIKGLPGIVGFACAHILYIAAYAVRFPPSKKTALLLVPWAVPVISFPCINKFKIKINFNGAGTVVFIYMLIICTMVILGMRTGILAIAQGGLGICKGLVLICGVLMFMVSDMGVCLQMFSPRRTFRFANKTFAIGSFSLVTYFGGQMLIAGSMIL